MKSSFFSLSICILLGLTSGCEGFLDRRPLDQLTSETFYRTEEEVRRGILAAYTPMMDNEWNGKGWMITEIPSDNSQPGGLDPDFTPIDNFTVAADNGPVGNYWAIHYRQIALANVVLDRVQEGVFTQDQLDLMLAEALFLRAVAYFDLVRVYGGVPLVTKAPQFGDDLLPSRATVEEVYALIREDLAFAADHLPLEWGGGDQGRATKGAALAYLSKVALTQRDFVPARDYAKAVMDLGVYRLMEDYADNFELGISDNNAEAIFQIQFTGCANFGTGNSLQAFFAPWGEGITKDRDGWGSQIPTSPQLSNPGTTILDAFEEDDARKPATHVFFFCFVFSFFFFTIFL